VVIEEADKLFFRKSDHLLLDSIAVSPSHQGKGFGRQLLEFAEAEALRQGGRVTAKSASTRTSSMLRILAILSLLALFGSPALADVDMLPGLVRESTFIPVELASGSSAKLEAMVVRPDRPGQLPLMIIVHGTPRNLANIVYMSPIDYLGPAVDFAIRGYAAVSIMRRGFGRSTGNYAERVTGPCNDRDYLTVGRSSAEDVLGAVAALGTKAWVDRKKIVFLGHSSGGFAITAAAATNPAGVVGVISFAGGRGSYAPDRVCGEDHLAADFGEFGKTARIPALWLVSEATISSRRAWRSACSRPTRQPARRSSS
jgi:pimeloyl-ACP methyl ester carboxylesterase